MHVSCIILRFRRLNEAELCDMSTFFVGNVFDINAERNILYDRYDFA